MRFLITILSFLILTIPANAYSIPVLSVDSTQELLSYNSKYVRIIGEINNVKKSDQNLFLHIGQNYKNSISAVIADEAKASFAMEGIKKPEVFYKNKKVMLEGLVKIINGKPQVIINFPAQIKVVN